MKYYIKGTDFLFRETDRPITFASIGGNACGGTMTTTKTKGDLIAKLYDEWFAGVDEAKRKGIRVSRYGWRKATKEELDAREKQASEGYKRAIDNIVELEAR